MSADSVGYLVHLLLSHRTLDQALKTSAPDLAMKVAKRFHEFDELFVRYCQRREVFFERKDSSPEFIRRQKPVLWSCHVRI